MTLLADTALPFNAPSFAYAKLQALMYCDTVAGDDALVIVHNSGQTTVLSDAVTIGECDFYIKNSFQSALHFAVARGNTATCRRLLDARADSNCHRTA